MLKDTLKKSGNIKNDPWNKLISEIDEKPPSYTSGKRQRKTKSPDKKQCLPLGPNLKRYAERS